MTYAACVSVTHVLFIFSSLDPSFFGCQRQTLQGDTSKQQHLTSLYMSSTWLQLKGLSLFIMYSPPSESQGQVYGRPAFIHMHYLVNPALMRLYLRLSLSDKMYVWAHGTMLGSDHSRGLNRSAACIYFFEDKSFIWQNNPSDSWGLFRFLSLHVTRKKE